MSDYSSAQRHKMLTEYATYNELADYIRRNYAGLPVENVMSAFSRTGMYSMFTADPYTQNTRVKRISSYPKQFGKDRVAEMLQDPDEHEMPIRQVANVLEYTAYPFRKIRTTYQSLLTYRNYIYPEYITDKDAERPEFMREWALADKLRKAFSLKANARRITGQTIRDGKVFYYPRYSIDKSHNKVNYAFMQQLPQDWTKIVGFNNISKYTVAFNLMYFTEAGTDYTQFGDLFAPYMDEFGSVLETDTPAPSVGKAVYAQKKSRYKINLKNVKNNVEAYKQNGRWFYWVILPIDKVFCFEADDVTDNVLTPLSGLIIAMAQLAQYEQVQLQIVQNPLVAFLTGEIPYMDNKDTTDEDSMKLSPTMRELFVSYWYQMLANNNTNGVGFYAGPFENMKLHQLTDAPSATEISGNGYAYAIAKSGLAAILPATTDNRAGVAGISFKIESEFAKCVYSGFKRMMDYILSKIGLKYSFRFEMFGSLAEDEGEYEQMIKSMELGILPDLFRYNALKDRSVLDDLSMSAAITASGILDKRIPLITSYSAKNTEMLPPKGGRPEAEEGQIDSEGAEGDIDSDASEDGVL